MTARRRVRPAVTALALLAIAGLMPPRAVSHAQVTVRTTGHELGDMLEDVGHLLRSPLRADQKDWLGVALTGAGFAALLAIDKPVDDWVVRRPMGQIVEWDAELEDERENERLAWRSAADAQVRNAGEVVFRDAPGGRGTEVHATISYEPPGGRLGHGLAKLWGEDPDRQARDDLRRLKQLMETGEIATAIPQPDGVG